MLEISSFVYGTSILVELWKGFDNKITKGGTEIQGVWKRFSGEINKPVNGNFEKIVNMHIKLQLAEKWRGIL